jgi:hypothetical protein
MLKDQNANIGANFFSEWNIIKQLFIKKRLGFRTGNFLKVRKDSLNWSHDFQQIFWL